VEKNSENRFSVSAILKTIVSYQCAVMLLMSILLIGCSTSRLQPCCRIKPGYGGFDRNKTIHLRQEKILRIAKYETEMYLIILDKEAILNDLKKTLREPGILKMTTSSNTADTLDLKTIEIENSWYVNKAIVKQLNHRTALVIEKNTGRRLEQLNRRKYNYQTNPKSGRGGIEYYDVENNIIIRLCYWIS
jgi:hypothetical protein